MLEKVKNQIQLHIRKRVQRIYQAEVFRQKEPYEQWILEHKRHQERPFKNQKEPSVEVVFYEDCGKDFLPDRLTGEYILFASRRGSLAESVTARIEAIFQNRTAAQLIYADEDCQQEGGVRIKPWFKPGWSPDTLLSFFYFGSMFAVRRQVVSQVLWLHREDFWVNLYDFVLKLTEQIGAKAVYHAEEIFFHSARKEEEQWMPGAEKIFEEIKRSACERRQIKESMEALGEPLVSIIIPSKDHPELLRRCLDSIKNNTRYSNYEICVVDNGSTKENRASLEQMRKLYGFTYVYSPMEFNFSKMCNLGVSQARGAYVLLLNDDCEATAAGWMELMLMQAAQPHVGAVGAKLLYPQEHLIQHAGITNLEIGPAHKLVAMSDDLVYYHGQNRLVYDMIGVTAACLMIAKEKYQAVGGFCEELKVSYNDVDFCFSLLEKGYFNVQRNDVILIHHESLSRGEDGEDQAKWERLLREKAFLYERHRQFYRYDPYYSGHLVGNAREYRCKYVYEYEKTDCFVKPKHKRRQYAAYRNECLKVTIEHAGLEKKLELGNKDVYLIEGWSYIIGMDNSRYRRQLLLTNETGVQWSLPVLVRYRKDVVSVFPGETNVALSGFVCRVPAGILAKGSYRLALLAKDACSGQHLYREIDTSLQVVV